MSASGPNYTTLHFAIRITVRNIDSFSRGVFIWVRRVVNDFMVSFIIE